MEEVSPNGPLMTAIALAPLALPQLPLLFLMLFVGAAPADRGL